MNLYYHYNNNQKNIYKKRILIYDINQNSYSNITNSIIQKNKISPIPKINNFNMIKNRNKKSNSHIIDLKCENSNNILNKSIFIPHLLIYKKKKSFETELNKEKSLFLFNTKYKPKTERKKKITKIKIIPKENYNYDILEPIKIQNKKIIKKLLIRKEENDTNGNNLYDENEKDDKVEKIFMGNSYSYLKDSLTKPYVKNKKNEGIIKINKEDNFYAKKLQKNLIKKIFYPKVGFRIGKNIQLYRPFKGKEDYNIINFNKTCLKLMRNKSLNDFYNKINSTKNEIRNISNNIFKIFMNEKQKFSLENERNFSFFK